MWVWDSGVLKVVVWLVLMVCWVMLFSMLSMLGVCWMVSLVCLCVILDRLVCVVW